MIYKVSYGAREIAETEEYQTRWIFKGRYPLTDYNYKDKLAVKYLISVFSQHLTKIFLG